jgi:medium-chain acyl-[acyl-carrier-protein] hydrolase
MNRIDLETKIRLFCFPYAGGSSAAFRTWKTGLSSVADVFSVELPGRGRRFSESPFLEMKPLVTALSKHIRQYLTRDFVFFGHSLGALVAYELTHQLLAECGLEPVHLFVSARGAPCTQEREQNIHSLSEEEFTARVAKLSGMPPEVVQNGELMKLVLPTLRADFSVAETYVYRRRRPLTCPITAFGGFSDQSVEITDLKAWSQETTGVFSLKLLAGGHFFLKNSEASLFDMIRVALSTSQCSSKPPDS